MGDICYSFAEIRKFSLPWQQGRSDQISDAPNMRTVNIQQLVQVSALYVLHNLSYSLFVLKFANFRYHCNDVGLYQCLDGALIISSYCGTDCKWLVYVMAGLLCLV